MRLAKTLKTGAGLRGFVLSGFELLTGFRGHMGWLQLRRPEFFGRPQHEWMQGLMRGPSAWTPWERELFASFVAKLESCPF